MVHRNSDLREKQNKNTVNSKKDHESDMEEKVYIALGHEFRRKILKLIGRKGFTGFSDIKKLLNVSTGTIYHHLEVLQDLIEQDERKKYHLSPLGLHAYQILQKGGDAIASLQLENKIFLEQKLKSWQSWALFQPILKYYLNHYQHGMIFSGLIVFIIAILSALFHVQAFVNIYLPIFEPFEFFLTRYPIIQFFSVFLGYIFLFFLVEGLVRALFHKNENGRWLFVVLSVSYIPLIFYLICIGILRLFPLEIDTFLVISRLLLVFFQVWGTVILALSISLVKFIKYERGLIIVLFIDYATLMVLLLFNTPFL
ncbi:MAG: winged helix-turn-helix domain-containing protein [Candidatus Lokiarchaeota archaeon]|nr:winged helix-turn-helix domain-containing protein [Candidatus Harpocratesius repetitus]